MSLSQEVMVRPPDVFVRELTAQEGARLKSISKRAKYQSKRQRAMILLASSTGMSAPQIAGLMRTDESHVRKVTHAFNERGFDSLNPDYRGRAPEEDDARAARPDRRGRARPPRHAGRSADALVAAQAGRAPDRSGHRL